MTAAVEDQNLWPFETLLELVTQPYEPREGCDTYAGAATSEFTKCYKTFCGT